MGYCHVLGDKRKCRLNARAGGQTSLEVQHRRYHVRVISNRDMDATDIATDCACIGSYSREACICLRDFLGSARPDTCACNIPGKVKPWELIEYGRSGWIWCWLAMLLDERTLRSLTWHGTMLG